VYADEIRIVVQSGFALLQRTATRQPTGLSAGIAFCHTSGRWTGHWDFRNQSPIVPIRRIQARGETLAGPLNTLSRELKTLISPSIGLQFNSIVISRRDDRRLA
jgi:hypothetical protein